MNKHVLSKKKSLWVVELLVMPQKYPRIFIIFFFIYYGYELIQTCIFPGKIDKLTNCEM